MAESELVKHLLDQVRDFKKRNDDNPGLVMSEHNVNIIALADEVRRLQSIIDERDAQTKKYGDEYFIVDASGNRMPGYPWV